MKKQIIFIFISLIFVFNYVSAQESDSAEKVIVAAAKKLNIIYMGLVNPVDIAVSDIPADKIKVTVDNGQIIGENGHYFLKPDRTGNCVISVFSDDKLIGECPFRVRRLKDPPLYLTLAGKTKGEISKKEIVSGTSLKLYSTLGDFDFEEHETDFRIIEFQISSVEEGRVKVLKGTGCKLNEDMIEFIQNLPIGSTIYINEIKVKFANEITKLWVPMNFKLIE